MLWTAYRARTTFLTFPWGIRLTAAVQNNGVINAGTVGLSNSPGIGTKCMGRIGPKCTFPERAFRTSHRSGSLGENPSTGSCTHGPAAAGEGSRALSSLRLPQFRGGKIEKNALSWIPPAQSYWEASERQNLVMKCVCRASHSWHVCVTGS